MKWEELPGSSIQAPLSCSGHYVISHRIREFTVSFRPPREHHHVGTFNNLRAAKKAAEAHNTEELARRQPCLF